MEKYYIYHIKDKKWGCTKNLKQRLKQQKYTLDDVCEIIEIYDLDEAANLEKELNLKHGYDWNDSQDYRVILKATNLAYKNKPRVWNGRRFTKEECQLAGRNTGLKKGEKQQKARRENAKKLNEYKTCPHCGIYSRGLGYNRYHGDKCRFKI